jgi:hypothetical protein
MSAKNEGDQGGLVRAIVVVLGRNKRTRGAKSAQHNCSLRHMLGKRVLEERRSQDQGSGKETDADLWKLLPL